ncbi:MAG: LysM peptidoglycan-binding domain-containing protein [Treponema sp.]|jgi:LysM repeat protein|nr:LysM peptidoglycan-binding domain-containing protein [Treponema sp.]
MKKIYFLYLVVLAALVTVSCKSTPVQMQEKESEPAAAEEAAFYDAYQSVLPLILDGAERYVVKEGETLTKIAQAKYGRGNAFFFPLIMAASKSQKMVNIADPDLIEPGMELIIPNLDVNRNNPEIRARIKTLLLSVCNIYGDRSETRWSSELIDGLSSTANSL